MNKDGGRTKGARPMCVIETSPVVETRRLILRAPGAQDVSRIAAMANDRDIARMTQRMPHPFQVEDAEDFVLHVAAQDPKRANTFVIEHEDLGPVGVIGSGGLMISIPVTTTTGGLMISIPVTTTTGG